MSFPFCRYPTVEKLEQGIAACPGVQEQTGVGDGYLEFQTGPESAYLRLVTHFKLLMVGPDQNMVTKRP